MKVSRIMVLVIAAAAVEVAAEAGGCQRQTQHEPAAAPAAQAASVPATQPEAATLQVDQQPFLFPQAVLRLATSNGQVSARLSSDDPPEAIQDNYHGNSFDLIMALNIPDPDQIDRAVWEFAAGSQPQRENGYGIFLDGQRRRLHPQEVVASFSRDGDRVVVDMKGVFFEYRSDDSARPSNPPPRVLVQGRLVASIEKQ
jgi:hypothetical protein